MATTGVERPHYFARLWRELGTLGGEHDAFIKVIIVERIVKAIVLIALGVGLLVAGRKGWLDMWATWAEDQLNLNVGRNIIVQLLLRLLTYIGSFNHITILAVSAIAYAALEGTEGVGLAMRRRWAEYLTVIATGILIPYEAYEVVHRVTLFKVGALLLTWLWWATWLIASACLSASDTGVSQTPRNPARCST